MRKTIQTSDSGAARSRLCCLLLAFNAFIAKADSTWVYSVQISATVQTSPPQITLNWEPDLYTVHSYTIYRKMKNDNSWGAGLTLPGSATSFTDSNVAVGSAYEYQIIKSASAGDLNYIGTGYIYAGIKAPLIENRGKLILIGEGA